MEHLADGRWLPPAIDPAWVIESVDELRYEACVGRLHDNAITDTNVVERLAIAHGLLYRAHAGNNPPPILMETLESLGFSVSPSFAEAGADAYGLLKTIASLTRGAPVDSLRRMMAYESLGRLWAAAFVSPAGFAHYIARSAHGSEPPGAGFFRASVQTSTMSPEEEARYLARLLDMLQAAIEVRELPASSVGQSLALPAWRAPSWAVYLTQANGRRWRLEVHVKQVPLGPGTVRTTVKLVETTSQVTVASIRAVILEGESGSYDDFITQAEIAGTSCSKVVDAAFAPSQAVGLYPRVRWLLEAAGDRLFKLAVVEGMYADRTWRQRGLGQLLLQQLIVETDMVDVLIGRPGAFEGDDGPAPMSLGVQAGYAVAKLSLARFFADMGAEYLVGGVMGMRVSALQRLHAAGIEARMG